MSNDLLPLPDILAEPPKESGRAAVAAEAAPDAAIVAVERNGRFLTEYPSRSHPDMNGLPGTINLFDAVTSSDSPIEVPTPLADGLADAAVTVRQIESILQANGTLTLEVHFAVERIHDVAMALRMREVDAALCDTLEASIREVGDAIVRNDAAAARALSAAALLCDLSRRIDQMIPRTAVAVSVRTDRPSGRRVLKRARTAPPAGGCARHTERRRSEAGGLRRRHCCVRWRSRPVAATAGLRASGVARNTGRSRSDGKRGGTGRIGRTLDSKIRWTSARKRRRTDDHEVRGMAGGLITVEAAGSELAACHVAQPTPAVEPSSAAVRRNECGGASKFTRVTNDPLAALHGLSEEELIALFT